MTDNQIRITIYSVTILAFIIFLSHNTWLNNFHISQAEKCFNSANYICAFNNYQKAFSSGINNEKYVEHYFQTLFKMKKNAIIQEELNSLYENYPNNMVNDDIENIFKQIKTKVDSEYGDNYINIAVQGTNIVHWNNNEPINVYINTVETVPGFYVEEVKKAFTDYQKITNNQLQFKYVNNENSSDIDIVFEKDISGGKCKDENCTKVLGITENTISGSILNKATIQLRTKDIDNTEFTPNQIHNIAKHEIGHALGINGHSFNEEDVMYPTNNDARWANNARTLLIKRKEFSQRDKNTIKLLYNIIPDITNKQYKISNHKDMYLPIAVLGTKSEIGQHKIEEASMYISNITNNFVAQMGLAESFFANQDYERAKDEFEKALTYAQTNNEKFAVYHNLAIIYYQISDYKNAINYAQMANSVSDNLEDDNSDEIQAYCYLEMKDYEKAQNLLEKLVTKNPKNATLSATLVTAYFRQFNIIKGLNELKRIKQNNPSAFDEPAYQQYKMITGII